MSDFFNYKSEEIKQKSMVLRKRDDFSSSIRRQHRQQKIKQLRSVNIIYQGQHMHSLVHALPQSLSQICRLIHLKNDPNHDYALSKVIIDFLYYIELQIREPNLNQNQVKACGYRLVHYGGPKNINQLSQQFFIFDCLLKYQTKYSDKLLRCYSQLLFQHAIKFNCLELIFQSLKIILKSPQLNWVPIQQLIYAIKQVELLKQQNIEVNTMKINKNILNQQIEVYYNLAVKYVYVIQEQPQIKRRILKLLQNFNLISKNTTKIKKFLLMCIKLTFEENGNENQKNLKLYQNQNIQHLNQLKKIQNQFKRKKCSISYSQALINGGISKFIFRNLFYAADTKIKLYCLNILRNVIIQIGSQMIWKQQKLEPVVQFQRQIRKIDNSHKLFEAFSQIFLLSILKIPYKDLFKNVVYGQTDTFSLIIYIIEHLKNFNCSIRSMGVDCIQMILAQSDKQIRQKISYTLLQKNCQNLLDSQDQLYNQVGQIMGQISSKQDEQIII